MRKLKIQFSLFFLLIAIALFFLLFNSYRQLNLEEQSLWKGLSEQAYHQIETDLADFLALENRRSFSEYRYYQALPGLNLNPDSLNVSPLSQLIPEELEKGLLGYFQMDPDGTFSTPYLPTDLRLHKKIADLTDRQELEKKLQARTARFREELFEEARGVQEDLQRRYPDLFNKLPERARKTKLPKPATVIQDQGVLSLHDDLTLPAKEKAESAPLPLPSPKNTLSSGSDSNERGNESIFSKADINTEFRSSPSLISPDKTEKKEAPSHNPSSTLPFKRPPPAEKVREEKPLSSTQVEIFQNQNISENRNGSALFNSSKKSAGTEEAKIESADQAPSSPKVSRKISPDQTLTQKSAQPEEKELKFISLFIDPFQVRLDDNHYLIFYRRVWIQQNLYLQGFVMDGERFFKGLMHHSLGGSELGRLASASLKAGDALVSQYPNASQVQKEIVLFSQSLPYPFQKLSWEISAEEIPALGTRLHLNMMAIFVFLLSTFGLFTIYRSAAREVELSSKRQDFISAVTHELKTPLTAIRMYGEMLKNQWVEEENKKDYYHLIDKESARLSRLIDRVLELSRLEKKTSRLRLKTACPASDFDEIGNELKPLASVQGFKLELHREKSLSDMTYDPEALKQVFLIFLENSLKFCTQSENKTLNLNLFLKGNQLLWEWKDHGPGVPKDELNKIFQKFYRIENENTRRTQGTGIGLALAQMIVQSMGGKVEASLGDEKTESPGLVLRLYFNAT